ncbi:MAG: hypothetical protein EOO36_09040 [Cytophagaceae bacterium]|nr:MAG: hypothetical protein EOO36_09040 [Cytophagaceae bacterium]
MGCESCRKLLHYLLKLQSLQEKHLPLGHVLALNALKAAGHVLPAP